jgi:uncharacterized membrane protein YozB (DUF420 family)
VKGLLAKPGFLGTYGTLGADLTLVLAIVFTLLFLIAWFAARKHRGNRHHVTILWAILAMFIYFSFYYLTRGLGVLAVQGREGFGGPDWFYIYIFTPTLTTHILLVSVGLVMAVYMIVLGFRASCKESGRRLLKAGELRAKDRNFYTVLSVVLAALCLLAVIRCETLQCASVYGAGLAVVIVVFSLEKLAERLFPKAERRHRTFGKFTMVVFLAILFTSALTYLFLYVVYQPQLA